MRLYPVGSARPAARHRASGPAVTTPMPVDYRPRHCDGYLCLHDHPGEPPLPLVPRAELSGGEQ